VRSRRALHENNIFGEKKQRREAPKKFLKNMKESQNTGWKESWRDEYLKWICGFANADGGKLHIAPTFTPRKSSIAPAFTPGKTKTNPFNHGL